MNGTTLLIAEDDFMVRNLVASSLGDGGYQILESETGSEAIRQLDENHREISGLITDIQMGAGPTGWEVARHARELQPEMPVVYMTGDSGHQWEVHGVPGSLLVQKPFASAEIVNAISNLIVAGSSQPGSSQ